MKNSTDRTQSVLFKDPVYDAIQVHDPLILDLIDTKEFQRLRRIKQLGTAQYTFHGAEHSRFSHSLGVYELARQIIAQFDAHYAHLWDSSENLVTLCAALLHDIGHGPFSHTFEKIFETDHEQLTQEIILNPETDVHAVLKRVSDSFPYEVASVIAKNYPNPQVVQLISSQMDADRMDYLQRDAYFTGVNYGAFDLGRILRVIRPYEDGVGFQAAGMHAVEDYVVRRYQMYMQVYFHPVSRGMEVTLDRLLTRAKDLYRAGRLDVTAPFMTPILAGTFELEDYLKLDDSTLLTAVSLYTTSGDPHLRTLSRMFLNRQPLKSVEYREENLEAVNRIQQLVDELAYDSRYFTQTSRSSDLSYDYSLKHQTPIYLIQPDETLIELSQASPIVKILGDHLHGNKRLYIPRELLEGPDGKEAMMPNFEKVCQEILTMIRHGKIVGN